MAVQQFFFRGDESTLTPLPGTLFPWTHAINAGPNSLYADTAPPMTTMTLTYSDIIQAGVNYICVGQFVSQPLANFSSIDGHWSMSLTYSNLYDRIIYPRAEVYLANSLRVSKEAIAEFSSLFLEAVPVGVTNHVMTIAQQIGTGLTISDNDYLVFEVGFTTLGYCQGSASLVLAPSTNVLLTMPVPLVMSSYPKCNSTIYAPSIVHHKANTNYFHVPPDRTSVAGQANLNGFASVDHKAIANLGAATTMQATGMSAHEGYASVQSIAALSATGISAHRGGASFHSNPTLHAMGQHTAKANTAIKSAAKITATPT